MASKDDDFDKENLESLKGNEEESFLEEQKQKKEAENVANQKVVRGDINLLGDGITWLDPEYDERLGEIRFYDQSHANADYEHWGKVPLWSSADAAALLFGKDPQIVTPDSIQPYIQSSGFPKKYMQMYTLIDRAVTAGELRSNSNLINPTDLLEWARQKQLDIPKELIDTVERDSICTKTDESAANQLERDPNAMAASRDDIDLDGDGITWIDKEYDERYRKPTKRDIDLLGDGITWYDSEYDERKGEVPFYEKPNAVADYVHWGMVAFYNSEEATALLLGKAPEIVTLESTKPLIQEFDFPKTYKKIYTLIERAVIAKELRSEKSLIKPVDLIEWANNMQLDIPIGMINVIEERFKDLKTESPEVQSNTQKKYEHDNDLQKIANHIARELIEQRGRRPTKEDVAGAMIKILDGNYPVERDVVDKLKANLPTRKQNNDDAFINSILRRIRAEW